MSLIEAIIRVHYDQKQVLVDVKYGTGKNRVPEGCLAISQTTRLFFEQGAVQSIHQKLLAEMPDVVVEVVKGINLPDDFESISQAVQKNLPKQ